MWGLARRNLAKERIRLAVSVGGVAFAVLLIVLIRGLFVAYETKVEDFYGRTGADLWVVQAGTADLIHGMSLLPDALADPLAEVEGVAGVWPYVSRQYGFDLAGEDTLVNLVGFDPDEPVAGPVELVRGSAEVGADGIVIDEVFANRHALALGDRLVLGGRSLEIAGIGRGGDMVMYQYAFADTAVVRDIIDAPETNMALLVALEPGADPQVVAADIAAASPQVMVKTAEEVVAEARAVINDGFLPVIAVLLVIGFLVGVAVVGLTIYSAVLERRREYGMLKALGARGGQVVAVVSLQALLAAAGGYVAGLGLAWLAVQATTRWVPAFVTTIRPGDLAWVAAATVGMALLAALLPLVRIARIDPAEVFRA